MKNYWILFAFFLIVSLTACTSAIPIKTATPVATETPASTATTSRTPWSTTDKTATVSVRETEVMGFLQDYVIADLDMLGYSISEGELGYQMQGPVNIIAELPHHRYWEPLSGNQEFRNFVLSMDIAWNSETGFAGCDILFRADDDVADGEHVRFSTMRLSGAPSFVLRIVKFNQWQSAIDEGSNMAIRQGAKSINHYVIAVDGPDVLIYVNGTKLTAGRIKENMTDGQIFFQAWQESGITTCTFSNAWVWELP